MAPAQSRLLSLPGELRNAIYKYAMTLDNQPLYVELPIDLPIGIGLLRTNRQVYDEARHYLFETNTFCFGQDCGSGLAKIARALEPHKQALSSAIFRWGSNQSHVDADFRMEFWRRELTEALASHPIRIHVLEIKLQKHSFNTFNGVPQFVEHLKCIGDVKQATVTGIGAAAVELELVSAALTVNSSLESLEEQGPSSEGREGDHDNDARLAPSSRLEGVKEELDRGGEKNTSNA